MRESARKERQAVSQQDRHDAQIQFIHQVGLQEITRQFTAAYKERGVTFVEEPRQEPYGTVAVFTDLYGNRWDLIEPKA